MTFNEDRATILRITFDLLYPNGQLKTVTMSLADTSEFKDVGIIAFKKEMIEKYLLQELDDEASQGLLTKWESKDYMVEEDGQEAPFKPSIFTVDTSGKMAVMCGGHGSTGHVGTGTAVNRYM